MIGPPIWLCEYFGLSVSLGQYCESKSVCCLSVDVVDELFVGCGKL